MVTVTAAQLSRLAESDRRLLRQPFLHFLLMGGLLFALDPAARHLASKFGWPSQQKPLLIISAAEQSRRAQEWAQQSGHLPSADDTRVLIDQAIEDEVLYREARQRGLDRNNAAVRKRLVDLMKYVKDPAATPEQHQLPDDEEALYRQALALKLDQNDLAIRRHLILQMRLLASLPLPAPAVTDAELEAVMQRHRESFLQPARYTLSQRFFSRHRRGTQALHDAAVTLRSLQSHRESAAAAGDPFPIGRHAVDVTDTELRSAFGPRFAAAVMGAAEDSWAGPVASIYGWHLVRIERRLPPSLPSVAQVRTRLLETLASERAQARYATYYPQLRAHYEIRIEDANTDSGIPLPVPNPLQPADSLD